MAPQPGSELQILAFSRAGGTSGDIGQHAVVETISQFGCSLLNADISPSPVQRLHLPGRT